MKHPSHPLRVGLFGIGLEAYWPQFDGLKPKLEGYLGQVAQRLGRPDVEVCNLGLIDSPEKAMEAGHAFRRADADVIFLHVTTYALSSTVLPVAQRASASIRSPAPCNPAIPRGTKSTTGLKPRVWRTSWSLALDGYRPRLLTKSLNSPFDPSP